ncbi:uncharacterized protein N7483_012322 [Penicillium malachiteum]|uniref:uncharacterized protein n=1 Tax=Penicillium malachiteum TaxID=1324776 RepID=UPI0025487B06|nr:uncharacterized protein N7483_012322 [Penicillium malachiteum]KAJ5715141.1 hypothetical protein N7483_012322 [Penicillium malachiteum]
MGVPRPLFRARSLLFFLAIICLLIWSSPRWTPLTNISIVNPAPNPIKSAQDLIEANRKLWPGFETTIKDYTPHEFPIIEREKAPTERFDPEDASPRPDLLQLDAEDIGFMKKAHAGFTHKILDSPPELNYVSGTRGLVSTAGGSYLPVLVISLRMLRRTGSTLPMEVFLANESEYEEYICDTVLPSLNASCVVLSHIMDVSLTKIETYQLKIFAMIFSSFEEILFLDADAFPLERPELLFESKPFLGTYMVTWPDFWASSTSPLFYEIADTYTLPKNFQQSTESGEILISKKTHSRTLLLATYYNYWGPTHFYPLLSQGAAGQGDKETFIAAAIVMTDSYYQVSEPICALGHRKEGGGMAGSAMAQFNPIHDYNLTRKGLWRVRGDSAPPPDVFFIHANFPKFNPATVFEKHDVNPAFLDDGTYTRAWTIPEDVVGQFSNKVDIEKAFWREILWTACELEDKFVSWEELDGICAGVKDYWHMVYESDGLPS